MTQWSQCYGEYVTHHVQEEEEKMFPKVQKSKMDLEEVGSEIAERKEELMGSDPHRITSFIRNVCWRTEANSSVCYKSY